MVAAALGCVTVRRISDPEEAASLLPMLDTYLSWVLESFATVHGVHLADPDPVRLRHHDLFREQLPLLLAPPGRMVAAHCESSLVGCGALLPIDATTGEVKRMYLDPAHRGLGAGRAILQRLLEGARGQGYRQVRLETSAAFMQPAHALYRSMGFVETGPFPGSETAIEGLGHLTTYMQLDLT